VQGVANPVDEGKDVVTNPLIGQAGRRYGPVPPRLDGPTDPGGRLLPNPLDKSRYLSRRPRPGRADRITDFLDGILNPIPQVRCYIKDPLPGRLEALTDGRDDGADGFPRRFCRTADAQPIVFPRSSEQGDGADGQCRINDYGRKDQAQESPECAQ